VPLRLADSGLLHGMAVTVIWVFRRSSGRGGVGLRSPSGSADVAKAHRRARNTLADRLVRQHAAGLATAPIQRFQHGQELGPEPMDRAPLQIANGVQVLYDAHAIGDAAMTAAERFRNNYELGVLGVVLGREWLGGCSGGRADPHIVQLARVRAVSAHRAIAAVLGVDLTNYLVAFAVDDLSFSAMDRRFGSGAASSDGRKEFSVTMRVLLCILPGIYCAIDNRKHAAPPARPVTASRDNRDSTTAHYLLAAD
jgi:hypothetical protein